jgi:hypothetical protein
MNDNLEIYGGFVGNEPINITGFRSRNSAANITILSGEIGDPEEIDDNSWHIVRAEYVSASAIIDGFTIRDAYANDAPELIENVVETEGVGGGLVVLGGPTGINPAVSAVFLRLRFTNNSALGGAGVFMQAGANNEPQFRNCRWDNNHAEGGGGAMVIAAFTTGFAAKPKFYNCLFHDNTAGAAGTATGRRPSAG